jgi:ADP-ribose pyrophosphatase
VKPVATDVVYRTPWFELVAKTMQPGEHPYYSIRIADYTVMIALTPEREILAVRQYRPALERLTLEFPAGLCEPGEDPAHNARRELIEETGYDPATLNNLGPITTDNGRIGNRMWVFLADDLRPVPDWAPEPGVDVVRYSIPGLMHAAASLEFDHSLHLGALLTAAAQGKVKLGV